MVYGQIRKIIELRSFLKKFFNGFNFVFSWGSFFGKF